MDMAGVIRSWVMVTVNDMPAVSQIADFVCFYNAGQTNNTLSWTVTDTLNNASRYYIVFRNGTQVSTGNWTPGVVFTWSVNNLALGNYGYNATVYDGYGGSVTSGLTVVVVNNIPLISTPASQIFTYNTGISISWTPTDTIGITRSYTIFINSSLNSTGSWISSTPITISFVGPGFLARQL